MNGIGAALHPAPIREAGQICSASKIFRGFFLYSSRFAYRGVGIAATIILTLHKGHKIIAEAQKPGNGNMENMR